jgi:hypothetical protein
VSVGSRSGILVAGFCGPKENHVCVPSYKVVGSGEPGYEKIVDSFQKDKIGGYARVIVVCSLHSALPRLVLSVTCTCGCFDSAWIKRQWNRIDMLWIEDCLDGIGPILGHANNGDSRRRKVMLVDYLSDSGERYRIPWDGWLMSACIDSEDRVLGFHDQDYVHNDKKLINPLDSPVWILQLVVIYVVLNMCH